MPIFYGEMQQGREIGRIPAVVTVDRGSIRLASGRSELGQWNLYEVSIEEYTDHSILLAVEDTELILFLDDHDRFMSETAGRRRNEGRRRLTHPAFRKDEGPTAGEELKDGMSREVSSIGDELGYLIGLIEPGPPLWIGLGVFAVLLVFLPGLLIGILLIGGVVGLAVGALAYADTGFAVRIPDRFTPTRLVAVGAALVALGILVAVVR